MMASPLVADMIEVLSHGESYSINLTSEFCHEPNHPVAIERGKMQSVVKKPLLVFLKCGDEFSGIEGWISSYSKKIQGDDTKNQIALNNEYLSGFGLIKDAEHFENLASEFPDNKIIKDLNSKLKDNLSIENWSINERKILSIESDHIIITVNSNPRQAVGCL